MKKKVEIKPIPRLKKPVKKTPTFENFTKYYAVLDFSYNLKKYLADDISLFDSLNLENLTLYKNKSEAARNSDPRYYGEELLVLEVLVKKVGKSKNKKFESF